MPSVQWTKTWKHTEMKSWDYYKTVTVPYPNKDEFTDVFVYSKGEVVWKGAYNDFKPFSDGRFKGMLVEKVVNEAGLKAQRQAYGSEQSRLAQEFKNDQIGRAHV